MFKRLATITVAGIILSLTPSFALAGGHPQLHGSASLLMDGQTGQVLYEQNGFSRQYPASTTKLLTALVALEHGNLDQIITISAKAITQEEGSSSCYLNQGERQRLEYLLLGLLLSSGNDCADAIAEGLTEGNPPQFIVWMNETAKRLGADNSNFVNPHGLHDGAHFTTAYDLALIARGALANPTLRQMAGTKEFVWPGKNNGTYYNHNAMLFTYDGTVGGKNGFTEQARLTLVSSAERNGQFLIGVVMGVDSRTNQYNDMTALLDYGFDSFEKKPVMVSGTPQGNLKVEAGVKETVGLVADGTIMVSARKGEEPKVTLGKTIPESIEAPVVAGQKIGAIQVLDGDRVLGSIDVVAQDTVEVKPLLWETAKAGALIALKWTGITLLGLIAVRLVVKTIRRAFRARKRRQARGRHPASAQGSDISLYGISNK